MSNIISWFYAVILCACDLPGMIRTRWLSRKKADVK